jgi:hypothetical protein
MVTARPSSLGRWAWRTSVEAEGLDLSFRPLAGLAQVEKPGLCGGDAGDGGRLELMTARQIETMPWMHLQMEMKAFEKALPHIFQS